MEKNDSLKEFISKTAGLREASLVVAKEEKELKSFSKVLDQAGFKMLSSVLDFNNAHNWCVVVDKKEEFKIVYDFVCQYPLTVVSLFDDKNSEIIVLRPDYKNSIIFLITEKNLKNFQTEGLDILGRIGLTYRAT